MPKVTIWIREEDYEKWKAIDNKPYWLHNALNEIPVVGSSDEPTIEPVEPYA